MKKILIFLALVPQFVHAQTDATKVSDLMGLGMSPALAQQIAAASNSSLYYSSTQNKLVYKDGGGTVHVLY